MYIVPLNAHLKDMDWVDFGGKVVQQLTSSTVCWFRVHGHALCGVEYLKIVVLAVSTGCQSIRHTRIETGHTQGNQQHWSTCHHLYSAENIDGTVV